MVKRRMNSMCNFECTSIYMYVSYIFLKKFPKTIDIFWKFVYNINCRRETSLWYIFLDSSMVEHTAVNRGVVGSSPTRGAFYLIGADFCFKSNKLYVRLHGQVVKTPPSQGGIRGSNPLGVIWRHSQVVRHGSATPWSSVQIWLSP